jgi:hypothetical protein
MNWLLSSFAALGLSAGAVAVSPDIHEHKHVHGIDCGHAAEWHVDHMDYYHDGHDHHMHANQVHEDETIVIHQKHDHVHGADCGHATRVKNNRLEYNHEGHWHHLHGFHYHESHE